MSSEAHKQDASGSMNRPVRSRRATAVAVRNVGKSYRIYRSTADKLREVARRGRGSLHSQFWALRDVTFHVGVGETVGIVGVNGAGKSTLLQIVCGTLAPTVGSIETRGRVAALLELGSGFSQEFTGEENIRMNAAVLGLSKEEIDRRFSSITEFADIGDFIRQPVKTYSSGMTMRLAFAVAANVDADILVIDEALAVGDAAFQQKCMRYLRRFRMSGTLLIVSHNMNSIVNLCDRAIFLQKGRLVAQGGAKEICQRYLESLFEAVQDINGFRDEEEPSKPGRQTQTHTVDQRVRFTGGGKLDRELPLVQVTDEEPSSRDPGAHITQVKLVGAEEGTVLRAVSSGERVTIVVEARAGRPLKSPLVTFVVKDRLGQRLFADNTALTYRNRPPMILAGHLFEARFTFRVPLLPPGDYSISAAVGEQTSTGGAEVQWLHDAVIFRSHSRSARPNLTGLVGVPMISMGIQVIE